MQERRIWAQRENDESCPRNAKFRKDMKSREYEPKSLYVLHTTRVIHPPERTTESDEATVKA